MTTRAREVEAWLRTEETRHRKANTALHSKYGRDYGALLDAAEMARRHADTVAELIAECETLRAALKPFADATAYDGEYTFITADFECAKAAYFATPPTPELITGEVGEE